MDVNWTVYKDPSSRQFDVFPASLQQASTDSATLTKNLRTIKTPSRANDDEGHSPTLPCAVISVSSYDLLRFYPGWLLLRW
jgi:hypothetical protein